MGEHNYGEQKLLVKKSLQKMCREENYGSQKLIGEKY